MAVSMRANVGGSKTFINNFTGVGLTSYERTIKTNGQPDQKVEVTEYQGNTQGWLNPARGESSLNITCTWARKDLEDIIADMTAKNVDVIRVRVYQREPKNGSNAKQA